jgi:hypothetical protein
MNNTNHGSSRRISRALFPPSQRVAPAESSHQSSPDPRQPRCRTGGRIGMQDTPVSSGAALAIRKLPASSASPFAHLPNLATDLSGTGSEVCASVRRARLWMSGTAAPQPSANPRGRGPGEAALTSGAIATQGQQQPAHPPADAPIEPAPTSRGLLVTPGVSAPDLPPSQTSIEPALTSGGGAP